MGRTIPPPPPDSSHPAISLSLLALSVAACITVVVTLCASCHPKPASPKPSPSSHHSKQSTDKENVKTAAADSAVMVEESENPHPPQPEEKVVLDMATHGPIPPATTGMERSPKQRLSVSLSMKITDGLSKIRTRKVRRQGGSVDASAETVWMKTIILGEKCRVPSDDEEEGTIVVSGGGSANRPQRNYHPKTPRSLPVSRTNSFVMTPS